MGFFLKTSSFASDWAVFVKIAGSYGASFDLLPPVANVLWVIVATFAVIGYCFSR
jgi:cell division protein FtsX